MGERLYMWAAETGALGFTSNDAISVGVLRAPSYPNSKFEVVSGLKSYKRDGIGIERIRTFPFSSNSPYDLNAHVVALAPNRSLK